MTTSNKALDRSLLEWYNKIETGAIKLPEFQRYEAWDSGRIASFFNTAIHDLPTGIALILGVNEPQFSDRYIKTAPQTNLRISEHLLDGQQRLTAFWRVIHNNYDSRKYFVYLPEFANNKEVYGDELSVIVQNRWISKNGSLGPVWADSPKECFSRGLLPTDLLKPVDISNVIDDWMKEALQIPELSESSLDEYKKKTNLREKLKDSINKLREVVKYFNLPYLYLHPNTEKHTALQVFINMNTNSKPLSIFDITVAEVESNTGEKLHQLMEALDESSPNIKEYFDLAQTVLYTSALIQNKTPNERGISNMDKSLFVGDWENICSGLNRMAEFLESQKIFDKERLPTNAVLAVLAAIFSDAPVDGDELGVYNILLKKYLWSSFFTDRYENSAASRAFEDFAALKKILTKQAKEDGKPYVEDDVPALNRTQFPITEIDELMTIGWPKGRNIRARAIMAVTTFLGAWDFADGEPATRNHLRKREYHHVFPDALLAEANIQSYKALNCALITGKTNRKIGRKDPYKYLEDRFKWINRDNVEKRLETHLIPISCLECGDYDEMDHDKRIKKIADDFDNFLRKRAELIYWAAKKLTNGEMVSTSELMAVTFKEIDK